MLTDLHWSMHDLDVDWPAPEYAWPWCWLACTGVCMTLMLTDLDVDWPVLEYAWPWCWLTCTGVCMTLMLTVITGSARCCRGTGTLRLPTTWSARHHWSDRATSASSSQICQWWPDPEGGGNWNSQGQSHTITVVLICLFFPLLFSVKLYVEFIIQLLPYL